ncbi:unnamed protein product [Toxocara canis]|uniref:Solute carrier family 13 member 3 n=1 Tax=Toxocara canis TaxID=6265 RepID=A0A183VFL3_TOXCA|nr:unnamed protein product [Toxocara canis]
MLGETNSKITFISWMEFALPPLIFYMIASLISILLVFYGPKGMLKLFAATSKEDRTKAKVATLTLAKAYAELGPMSFAEKSVLGWMLFVVVAWILRAPGFTEGWAQLFFGPDGKLLTDTSIGIFVVFVLFVWPKKSPRFIAAVRPYQNSHAKTEVASSLATEGEEALLTWNAVQRRFPWSVILLIGAGFAISEAVKKSCLEDLISERTRDALSDVSPIVVQAAVTTVITFMTEFASNVATASVFVPIALNLAVSLGVHPLYLGLPSAIAPSFSFMFPMATPPNAIVYDTNVITMLEMASAGMILNVLCIAITTLNMNTWAYWLFNLGTLPSSNHYLLVNSTCIQ